MSDAAETARYRRLSTQSVVRSSLASSGEARYDGRTALRGPLRAAGRQLRELARSPESSRAVRRYMSA
jgi:hypothetical protein